MDQDSTKAIAGSTPGAGEALTRSAGSGKGLGVATREHLWLMGAVVLATGAVVALGLLPVALGGAKLVSMAHNRVGKIPPLASVIPPPPQRSALVDTKGRIIQNLFFEENRVAVSLAEVPRKTQQAVLAIEDARFYEHRGIDLVGIVRAFVANAKAGGVREGGSTITQQYVKNVLVGGERSVDRKLREAIYAIQLAHRYDRHRILEMYLNETYFGDGVYGIGTAAQHFFGKPVGELSIGESAALAGAIRSPTRYQPTPDNIPAATGRRDLVLERMRELGYIGEAEAGKARSEPLVVSITREIDAGPASFFRDWVTYQLTDPRSPEYSEFSSLGDTAAARQRVVFQGGLTIGTTLDLDLVKVMDTVVNSTLSNCDVPGKGDPQAAMAGVDPRTGAVVSMVGGLKYGSRKEDPTAPGCATKVNQAVGSKGGGGSGRHSGSSFKAFTLAAALENGYTPLWTFDTPSPLEIPGGNAGGSPWVVHNAEGAGEGIMDMRKATAHSVNTYFAQLVQQVGADRVAGVAERMGITSALKPYLSITLGSQEVDPLEMASAFGTLANRGVHCKPYAVARILDSTGRQLYEAEPSCERAVSATVAAEVTELLTGVITGGTGTGARIDRPAAGKTGTTDDYGDAWFVGYVPQLSTACWMGDPRGSSYSMTNVHGRRVFGGTFCAPMWGAFMKQALKDAPVEFFPEAPAITTVTVPKVTAMLQPDAIKSLKDAGLSAILVPVSSGMSAGTVLRQGPAEGSTVPRGSPVTLSVSDGMGSRVVVPNVVGMADKEATKVLIGAGFAVETSYVLVEDRSQIGVVLSQTPAAGNEAERSSTVKVSVGLDSPSPTPTPSQSPSAPSTPEEAAPGPKESPPRP